MGKKDYLEFSESANWNVAEGYSKTKILKPLVELDRYLIVAEFGAEEMVDEFNMSEDLKDSARLKALRRVVSTMLLLIENSKFALKKKDTGKFSEYKLQLKLIQSLMKEDIIFKYQINHKSKSRKIKIIEEKFDLLLEKLRVIKEEFVIPMNDADLIFSSTEDEGLDPDDLKKKIMEDIITAG